MKTAYPAYLKKGFQLCHSSTWVRWAASINFLNRNGALPAAN